MEALLLRNKVFAEYRPSPKSDTRFAAKIGAFFPPISFENTGVAWTSAYTLSSSAINTWIGEEFRVYGSEGAVLQRLEGVEVAATAAVFGGNDPAGALLAWRGWAITDLKAGVFERLPLAKLRILAPNGSAAQQAPWVELTDEVDGRVGAYASLSAKFDGGDQLRLTVYDNRARDTAFNGFQYAWHTKFVSVGGVTHLPDEWDVIAQGLAGSTRMGTKIAGQPLVAADFSSAFVLVSKAWASSRISLRAEYFKTIDKDRTVDDDNSEHGGAVTLAYMFRPTAHQRLSLEVLHVVSTRPERTFEGFTARADETQIQAAYRLSF